jgi:hypothetical protein
MLGSASSGMLSSTANNCVVYYNTGGNFSGGSLNNCCTTPIPTNGIGNFTNAPLFMTSQNRLRLQPGSPCINAGNNSFAIGSTDLGGNDRISAGTVDVGAYEFQNPSSVISYAWLQQFHLPVDGSADYSDSDQDGMNNWQEWICGTIPTNATSVLRQFSPTSDSSGLALCWQSVTDRSYSLERAAVISSPQQFLPIQTGILGQPNMTCAIDSNWPSAGIFYYRIRVEH